jgi:hypothetical protein
MSVAGDTLSGIGLWVAREERKEERDDAALQGLLTALNTTKVYIAHRERGELIDREKEARLVELWTAAAVQIRRSDEHLAMRLQAKAEYWTNPENWTADEVRENRFQIDQISHEAKKLLAVHRPSRNRGKKWKTAIVGAVAILILALGIATFWKRDDSKVLSSLIDRGREPIRGKVDTCRLYLHDVGIYLKKRSNPRWHEFDNASHSRDPNFLANEVNEAVPILESISYEK